MSPGIWATLGLAPTKDVKAIRKAYADRLRAMEPDADTVGFARLREARDHALRIAAAARPEAPETEPAYEAQLSEQALFTVLEADERPYEVGVAEPETTLPPLPSSNSGGIVGVPIGSAEGESPVGVSASEPVPERSPEQSLADLLFPGDERADQPFTDEEEALALACLQGAISRAEAGDIDLQQAAEEGLASWLANAWPRSAPLLEPASTHFRWLEQAGTLSERGAIRFLNDRLRGMRFHHMVRQRGHPLRNAWLELTRPGPRTFLSRFRADGEDVDKLLRGVRERYPEVESYLDERRVQSWETRTSINPARVGTTIAFVFFILVQIAGVVSRSEREAEPPPVPLVASDSAIATETKELFGPETEITDVASRHPPLANDVRKVAALIERYPGDYSNANHPHAELIQRVRTLSQLAAASAKFTELVAIKEVRLRHLQLAREEGGTPGCMTFMRELRLPLYINVDTQLRVRERDLARTLLLSGDLLAVGKTKLPTKAMIPGSVFEQARKGAGLTEQEAELAAMHQGPDENVCDFAIALLTELLQRPSQVPLDLLRMN